jgi:hypothetical protein
LLKRTSFYQSWLNGKVGFTGDYTSFGCCAQCVYHAQYITQMLCLNIFSVWVLMHTCGLAATFLACTPFDICSHNQRANQSSWEKSAFLKFQSSPDRMNVLGPYLVMPFFVSVRLAIISNAILPFYSPFDFFK